MDAAVTAMLNGEDWRAAARAIDPTIDVPRGTVISRVDKRGAEAAVDNDHPNKGDDDIATFDRTIGDERKGGLTSESDRQFIQSVAVARDK